MSEIGENIKKIAKEENISLKELSQKLNIKYTTFHSFINKKNNKIDIAFLEKLSDALNVSPSKIIDYSDNMQVKYISDYTNTTYPLSFLDKKNSLLQAFDSMNETGQKKAVDIVEDLSKVPEYQKSKE